MMIQLYIVYDYRELESSGSSRTKTARDIYLYLGLSNFCHIYLK